MLQFILLLPHHLSLRALIIGIMVLLPLLITIIFILFFLYLFYYLFLNNMLPQQVQINIEYQQFKQRLYMLDNQIDIRPQHINMQPQLRQMPPPPQEQTQFQPAPEIIAMINDFRSRQGNMQATMQQSYQQLQDGEITKEQFESVRVDMQNQQNLMMTQMDEFQKEYEPQLRKIAEMNQQQNIDIQGGQSGGHSHGGRQCNHDHSGGGNGSINGGQSIRKRRHGGGNDGFTQNQKVQLNPFANMPSNMRVFVFNHILGGNYFFSLFMQLPMMPAGFQAYNMAKNKIVSPIFSANDYINATLDKPNLAFLRPIFGGLGIFYLLAHYLIYTIFLQGRVNNLVESEFIKNLITYDFALIMIFALLTVIVDPGDLTKAFHRPQFQQMTNERPELHVDNRGRFACPLCDIPRVIRSQHCMYAKKCIARYESQSSLLNVGIGAYNYPFYLMCMIALTFYFFIVLYIFTLDPVEKRPKQLFDLFIIIINLHQLYCFGQATVVTMLKVFIIPYWKISYNITQNELYNWRRYPYFTKNDKGEFYNPFDQGFIKNWCGLYLPLINRALKRKYSYSGLYVIDWAQAKLLNITDIQGHPMASRVAEGFAQQLSKQQENQRQTSERQIKQDEQQGLLQGDNA